MLRFRKLNPNNIEKTLFKEWIRAATKGHLNIIKQILSLHPQYNNLGFINQQTKGGNTALIKAAKNGHAEIVEFLLEQGANVFIQNKKNRDAEDQALIYGHHLISIFLYQVKIYCTNAYHSGKDTQTITQGLKQFIRNYKNNNSNNSNNNINNNNNNSSTNNNNNSNNNNNNNNNNSNEGQDSQDQSYSKLEQGNNELVRMGKLKQRCDELMRMHNELGHQLDDLNYNNDNDNDASTQTSLAEKQSLEKMYMELSQQISEIAQEISKLRQQYEDKHAFRERLNRIKYQGTIPDEFICPNSKTLMNRPIATPNGITFDLESLQALFDRSGANEIICPVTTKPISKNVLDFAPNAIIKDLIAEFVTKQEKRDEAKENDEQQEHEVKKNNQLVYICPISQELMNFPIGTPSGITYDLESLEALFNHSGANVVPCPVTREPISKDVLDFKPNVIIKELINACVTEQKKKDNDNGNSPVRLFYHHSEITSPSASQKLPNASP